MDYIKGLKRNVLLSKYTTYKIGGPADYFFIAKNKNDLLAVLQFAHQNSLFIFILAGGSNILFSDDGFRGLVIKIDNRELEISGTKISTGAGVMMPDLVNQSISAGLSGLEWAGGLPGTFGGAIRGNAGCFGGEIKDSIGQVSTVSRDGQVKYYSNKNCAFSYRDSIFKHNSEIILSATLSLNYGDPEKLKKIVFDHIKYRQERHPLEFPNCGSVFKNCPIEIVPEEIQKKFKDKIKNDPFPVLPTAVLISIAGLKGKTYGGAKISEKHPNFIVNTGNAQACDIIDVMDNVKEKIKKQFNIDLIEEVELVGF